MRRLGNEVVRIDLIILPKKRIIYSNEDKT